MIRVFNPPPRPHAISRVCDDRTFWLPKNGGITCVCEEKERC